MKKFSVVLILFAVMLCCMKGETVAVETGVYHGEAIVCTSTDPYVGANYTILAQSTHHHALFNSEYDSAHAEKMLALMDEWGMRHVRVFDGPLLSAENTFLPNVANNINDFLDLAANHGITVQFTFTSTAQWMYTLYNQRTSQTWEWHETEYNTSEGRNIYGDRMKYVISQCFANRSQDIVYDIRNEPSFQIDGNNPWAASMTESEKRSLAVTWVNYMYSEIRSVDTRANHKVTVGLVQSNAPDHVASWAEQWVWHPGDMFNWTNLEIIDMHFYHLDSSQSWTDEFDEVFGWWAPYCTKPIIVGEMGRSSAQDNEKQASQDLLDVIHHIRNTNNYSDITDVLIWTATPYYKTFDVGNVGPKPFNRLTDGYTGFTRLGASIRNDQYVAETCSANYSIYSSYVAANLNDYNDNTKCILQHVPSVAYPSNYEINFNGQWYRFHKIRIVDKTAPYPRDFKVYVYNGGWQLFGTVTNNTAQTVDVVTTAASGWMAGVRVKIEVTNESGNWSSLHEIYINPVTIVTE